MEPLPGAEIRERFLRFYEERGHARLPSDSLIPRNDPTLLFTGAGMNQFKDMFLGKGTLPHTRVATSQKCLRVPDLEEVGRTAHHHTFFEMLGHFSFGDYFKEECIVWEWGFFTQALGMPAEQLVVSVYEDDEEAYQIWRDKVGLRPERIYRFGEKENFWPAEAPSRGPNGPCGPCSEIYFDQRPQEAFPKPEGLTALPARFTEIGNCVFTQFDRQEDGTLAELPQRNIDVGLGLERITAVLQGVTNNFDTDLFRPYLDYLQKRSGKAYGKDKKLDEHMRRISDHVRALTFCIADGATPSNEGRGYVVRKILRRAGRDGYELGIQEPFLFEMVDVVGESMGVAYPEERGGDVCRRLPPGHAAPRRVPGQGWPGQEPRGQDREGQAARGLRGVCLRAPRHPRFPGRHHPAGDGGPGPQAGRSRLRAGHGGTTPTGAGSVENHGRGDCRDRRHQAERTWYLRDRFRRLRHVHGEGQHPGVARRRRRADRCRGGRPGGGLGGGQEPVLCRGWWPDR
jgi:hypothetical protein